MNSEKMKQAYPISAHLDDRLQNTFSRLPERRAAGRPAKKRLTLILTACLMLAGAAALADSQWGILNYLRSMGEPTGDSRGLDERVTAVRQTRSAYNTEVTISDAVFDGSRMAFALEYKNSRPEEPVYIIVTGAGVNGSPLRLETENDTPSHIWLPGMYFTEGHTQNGLFGTPGDIPEGETLAVSVAVSVFKPLRPIKNLPAEEGGGDDAGRMAEIERAYEEGFISLSEDHINLPEQAVRELAQKNGGQEPDIPEILTALGLMERKDLNFAFSLKNAAK